ncbi:MAG: hypothetical protein V4717_09425 [Bacteroidota bacterium]
MLRVCFFILVLLSTYHVNSQDKVVAKWHLGIEADALPYATGGYFAAIWAGKKHVRVRALTARVYKPNFITDKNFINNNITAYAITTDYFFKPNWKGLWLAAGLVYWKSSIQSATSPEIANFNNGLVNGSAGFNIRLYKHLYLSPWAGISTRVAGDKNVVVGNKAFHQPFFNPEASLKIGFYW